MITFSRFGVKGNLGNQLFQLASLIGFSKKYNQPLHLPAWTYKRYFQHTPYTIDSRVKGSQQMSEGDVYHYAPEHWDRIATGSWNIDGWLQTEKYWEHAKEEVRKALTWERNFEQQVLNGISIRKFENAIAITVRRGDYVGNPNYDLLPVSYYMQALMQEFPDYLTRQIMIFSDDIPYCKIHFAGLPNVWFADKLSPIVQLCIMSHCNNFVISNSTFSWWGAYLAEMRNPDVKVVRPKYLFAGPLLERSDSKDHWPERWTVYDHKEDGVAKKYDLKDVTFTIPVMFDHVDRQNNLSLMLCLLQRQFDTNIMIAEASITPPHEYHFMDIAKHGKYYMMTMEFFHRTMMLNQMAMDATTPIIVNWDADVCIPEVQVVVAVEMIRNDFLDGVYPYDGRFARVPRNQWFHRLEKELDPGVFKGVTTFEGAQGLTGANSVGGAVIWNRAIFLEGGGENENFISHAPEDAERWERFRFLGYKMGRVRGQLFHMDHWVGPNSSNRHGHKKHNDHVHHKFKEILNSGDVKAMWEWVKSWPWYMKQRFGPPAAVMYFEDSIKKTDA